MKISVAICTWNRAELLRQTLQSLRDMKAERIDWELVVVDNNSTDHTADVIDSFRSCLPLVSVVEKQQGHAFSRNRAVETCRSDYIVWTDNDVSVSGNWLTAYQDAFLSNPEIAFFGGEISPEFLEPQPQWIDDTWHLCKQVYATRMLGDEPIELNAERLPYGANYAMRMDVQKSYLYDTKFGRKPDGMIGEDETAVLRQIANAGMKGQWVPGAKLKHLIPGDRMTESYVQKYFFGQGLTNISSGKLHRNRLASLCSATYNGLLYRIKRHRTPAVEWVSHMIRSSLSWGELRGRK